MGYLFRFQGYILPHTLNCIYVSLSTYLNFKAVLALPMYISADADGSNSLKRISQKTHWIISNNYKFNFSPPSVSCLFVLRVSQKCQVCTNVDVWILKKVCRSVPTLYQHGTYLQEESVSVWSNSIWTFVHLLFPCHDNGGSGAVWV